MELRDEKKKWTVDSNKNGPPKNFLIRDIAATRGIGEALCSPPLPPPLPLTRKSRNPMGRHLPPLLDPLPSPLPSPRFSLPLPSSPSNHFLTFSPLFFPPLASLFHLPPLPPSPLPSTFLLSSSLPFLFNPFFCSKNQNGLPPHPPQGES